MTKGRPGGRPVRANRSGRAASARYDELCTVILRIQRRRRTARRRDADERDGVAIPLGLLRLERGVEGGDRGLAPLLDLERDLGVSSPHTDDIDGAARVALDAPEREAEVPDPDRLANLHVERAADLSLRNGLTGLELRIRARRRIARAGSQCSGDQKRGAELTHACLGDSGLKQCLVTAARNLFDRGPHRFWLP